MANRFTGVVRRLPSLVRQAFVVSAAVLLGVALMWTSAVAQKGPGTVLLYDPALGIIPPDMKCTHKLPDGSVIRYEAKEGRGPATVFRNGKPWVTITYKDGAYILIDPNGTSEAVLKTTTAKKGESSVKASVKGR